MEGWDGAEDEPEQFTEWADGISVTKSDHELLTRDLHLFGSALVETIGGQRGRRIAPENFFMRAADAKPRT